MYLLIIFLPLIGSCFTGFFGKKFGPFGCFFISSSLINLTFLISFFGFYEIGLIGCNVFINLSNWLSCEFLNVDWGFMFDSLTILMCCIVTFVSFLVHFYSIEYMGHDPHVIRFMSYLSLFTFFMLILVTADNFIQMFLGWEGVGLCSYLLINFWYTRVQANKAAIQAMILNRIGDFGLIIGILIILTTFSSVDYASTFSIIPLFISKNINFFNFKLNLIFLISLFIFIGAIGKSAQLGLHVWLPSAMEGPTPVSALIHAATMVTAGVFLITRCSPIFEFTPNILIIVCFFGASTAFFAASVGLLQNDLKRVIAYSTCSQLGYMVFSCGLSNYSVAIFHLSNHAFFKALLFLGAGSVIHAVNNEQDIRKMGGLKSLIPFTYSSIVIGSLALIGFPFLTGFYSKDLILEISFGKFSIFGHFSYCLGTIGAFFTAFYSTRLIFLTFLTLPNGFKTIIGRVIDCSFYICFSLICLIIPSIFVGYFTKELLVGIGNNFWLNAIFNKNENRLDSEFIFYFYKLLPVFVSFLGVLIAFLLYNLKNNLFFILKTSFFGKKIFVFLNKKWFFDKLYHEIFSQGFFKFGYEVSYKIIDKGIIEVLGPNGISLILFNTAKLLYSVQTQYLYHYTIIILSSSCLFLLVFKLLNGSIFLLDNNAGLIFFVSLLFFSHFKLIIIERWLSGLKR